MNVKFFGREPALVLVFVSVVVQACSAFWWNVSADQMTWINASAAAVVGLIVAIVAHDSLSAPVLGGVQATVALAVGFGLDWNVNQQAMVMAVVAALVGLFVRQQVTAPVPAPAMRQFFG